MSMSVEQSNDLIVLCDGGVKKKIITTGNGEKPPVGSEVKVHYVGTLLDGTEFDSSRSRNEPFVFKLGEGKVIKGWDEGVATMSIGEKSLLICSPEYAYGKHGSPPKIPPNATLQFEVELLEFNDKENVTDDGGVKKSIKKKGEGYQKPSDDTTVVYKYKLSVKNTDGSIQLIEDHWENEEKLLLGDDPAMPSGVEEALRSMYKGEHSIFFIRSDYGYGEKGLSEKKIPPHAFLIMEIELLSFIKSKETWDMTNEEKIEHMIRCKEQGNKFFKANQIKKASKKYSSAIKVFQYEKNLSADEEKKINEIKLTCHSNAATCKYKERNWEKVLSHANDGLLIDTNHLKCLFKRAQANAALDNFNEANNDFKKCLSIDGNNVEIKKEYQSFLDKQRKLKEREQKTFGGFFNKVHLFDENENKEKENIAKAQMDVENNNNNQTQSV